MRKTFKFFWFTHKWFGILLTAVFLLIAVTGFLLLIKKEVNWIMPPTYEGAPGGIESFIGTQQLFRTVLGHGHDDFAVFTDIDRVDFRPHDRVFKVTSIHNNAEIQVDAVTGQVLNVGVRRSDWLESLHDGSFFGEPVHDFFMPLVPVAIVFLSVSGLWLWIAPAVRRRQLARKRAEGEL